MLIKNIKLNIQMIYAFVGTPGTAGYGTARHIAIHTLDGIKEQAMEDRKRELETIMKKRHNRFETALNIWQQCTSS